MEVFTSSWFANLPPEIQKIGISRGTPRGYAAGYRKFGAAAPGPWFSSVSPDEYMRLYYTEVLKPLDLDAMMRRLEELGNGRDVALLCYERAPFEIKNPGIVAGHGRGSNWCHRRVASAYIHNHLGIEVREYGTTEATIGPDSEQWIADTLGQLERAVG